MTNIVEHWITNWYGVIGNITPAFKQYAFSILLAQANFFNQAWTLGLPAPITTNNVTEIYASPRTNGLTGSILINERYFFSIADGRLRTFADQKYDSRSIKTPEQYDELARTQDLLTTKTALTLAQDALAKIGIPKSSLTKEELLVRQSGYDRPIPLYFIDGGSVDIQVSGVTSNVVQFINYSTTGALRIPPPTNYFEMIGATNEATRQPKADLDLPK